VGLVTVAYIELATLQARARRRSQACCDGHHSGGGARAQAANTADRPTGRLVQWGTASRRAKTSLVCPEAGSNAPGFYLGLLPTWRQAASTPW